MTLKTQLFTICLKLSPEPTDIAEGERGDGSDAVTKVTVDKWTLEELNIELL
jgi:hypothetical protein